MGADPDGILVYGYALGGPEEGWKVEGVDKYGSLVTSWYRLEADDYENPDGDDDDFATMADRALLIAHGFTEEYPEDVDREIAHAYFDRKLAAEKSIGVEVRSCGGPDYPGYLLAAFHTSAEWSETVVIDWQALDGRRIAEEWDSKLSVALHHLGLKPTQERPQWLLTSAYG